MTPEERRKVNAVIQGSQQHGQLKQQWGGGGYRTQTPATFRQEQKLPEPARNFDPFGNRNRYEQRVNGQAIAPNAPNIARPPGGRGPSLISAAQARTGVEAAGAEIGQTASYLSGAFPRTSAALGRGAENIGGAKGFAETTGQTIRAGADVAGSLLSDVGGSMVEAATPILKGGRDIVQVAASGEPVPRQPTANVVTPSQAVGDPDGITSSNGTLRINANNSMSAESPAGQARLQAMATDYQKRGIKTSADLAASVNTVPPDAMRRLTGAEPMGREQTPAVSPGLARMQQDQVEYDQTWNKALREYGDPRSTSGASKAVADAMRMIEQGDKKSIRQAGADLLAGYQEMAALEQRPAAAGGTDPQLARLQYDMMNDAQQRQYNQQKDQRDFTIQQSSAERALEKERREGVQAAQPMWETSLDPVGVRSTALQLNELYGADLATTTALYEAEVAQLSDKVRKNPEEMAKARNAIMDKLAQAYQE